jgi:SAM-dependent methyltransferase
MSNLFRDLIKETLRGKSLPRILINNRMRETEELTGKILDLASGTRRPSAYRFLKTDKDAQFISVDISDERKPDIKADLENPFPFEKNDFDYVTCFNLLEHIFNYKNVINESFRVLKNNGKFIGTIPFLGSVHGDPDDYFRYTDSTLNRLFKAAGFRQIKIEALGYGPFAVSYYLTEFLLPKFLRPIFVLPAIALDKIIYKLSRRHGKNKYVLMYYFECQK